MIFLCFVRFVRPTPDLFIEEACEPVVMFLRLLDLRLYRNSEGR